ncbi:MAG: 4Fe-4S dicluster domain-containing protein [Candidatus Thorarchaeota archaeon]
MSESKSLSDMAPKRRRMMDMVLALGGLKEEAVIPLSKVSEEIANLKSELEPLAAEILAFPNAYFEQFLETTEKSDIVSRITDKGLLKQASTHLQEAVSLRDTGGTRGLLNLINNALEVLEATDEIEDTIAVDIESVLSPVSDLVTQIEDAVTEYEAAAEAAAESARSELKSLVASISEAVSVIQDDVTSALDALQKLGTKTRYGPFLRTSAQVKRGIREGRIDKERALGLVSENILIELRRGVIMFILSKMGSRTVLEISKLMESHSSDIQIAIVSMIQRSEVEMVGLDGDAPVFSRVLESMPDSTLVFKRILQQLNGIGKSLEGDVQASVNQSIQRMEPLLGRLQKLGQYDETILAEPMNILRETVDQATEAVLQSKPADSSEDLRLLVSAGLEAFARFRLKITLEKGPNLVSGTNVYGEKLDPEVYEKMMSSYLDNELERGTILILIRELGALTAKDLGEKTNIPKDRILQHLLRMKRDELLTSAGESHGYLLYDVPRTPTEAELAIETASSLALQLNEASSALESLLQELKAEDIGKMVNALETLSKGRDKLVKLTIEGNVVGEDILVGVEEKIRSAVSLSYRTRAKIPSTRPKVTLDDLAEVDVPSVLDEYKAMMGYAPLLGFGTIEWDISKCLGCKSCEIVCPEDAIELKPVVEVSKIFDIPDESLDSLPVNRSLFYKTVKGLATQKPTDDIVLADDSPGFGTVEVDLWLCVACRTCVRRCPGPDEGALELELKWSLPEVVRQITSQTDT